MTTPRSPSLDPFQRSYRALGVLPTALRLSLQDLRADLAHSRRQADLGRLALLCYCEVRYWARRAGEEHLATRAAALVLQVPPDRDAFLQQVDDVIRQLEAIDVRRGSPSPRP